MPKTMTSDDARFPKGPAQSTVNRVKIENHHVVGKGRPGAAIVGEEASLMLVQALETCLRGLESVNSCQQLTSRKLHVAHSTAAIALEMGQNLLIEHRP